MGFFAAIRRLFTRSATVVAPATPASIAPPPRSLSTVPPPPASRPSTRLSLRPDARILSSTEESWERLKAFLRGCDRHGIDLAKLQPNDPVGYWMRRLSVEDALRQGLPLERAAEAAGFSGAEHYRLVSRYFEARYSRLAPGADGALEISFTEDFQRAAQIARIELEKAAERASEARLLEPIQGIDLERFAELAAAVATLGDNPSRVEMSHALAEFGVGSATFGAARRGWLDRMKEDKTGRLRDRFLEVFRVARHDRASSGVHVKGELDERQRAAAARRSWVADFDLTG